MISKKQKQFLISILPNPEIFVNKLIDWPINDVGYMSKNDYKIVIEYLSNLGCYMPKSINTSNYELTLLDSYTGIDVFMQRNLYRNTTLKVMRLENIMVLDFDYKNLEDICSYLSLSKYLNFKIYKTTNGYHAYCVNKFYNHKNYSTLQLMKDLNCDNIYIHFCSIYGFIIRAQKKTTEEPFIEKFERYLLNSNEENNNEIEAILNKKDSILKSIFS